MDREVEAVAGSTDDPQPLPLPPSLLEQLGDDVVEYEGFAVGSLAPGAADEALAAIRNQGFYARIESERTIDALAHRFDPSRPETRPGEWAGTGVSGEPLAGLAWVQFGFPIKAAWYAALEACGAELLAHTRERTVLASVPSLDMVTQCVAVVSYLTLVEPVLSTDRAHPSILGEVEALEVSLAPNVTADDLAATMPAELLVERVTTGSLSRLEAARVIGPGAGAQLLADARVLRIVPVSLVSAPSDERQAQILARNWEPSVGGGVLQGEPRIPAPLGGGYQYTYLEWLTGRGLYSSPTSEHEQTIAVFDTGVDNGVSSFHDDIDDRVKGSFDATTWPMTAGFGGSNSEDSTTHGTHVIGTIAGEGLPSGRAGNTLFAAGQGIAPQANVISVKVYKTADCTPGKTPGTGCACTSVSSAFHGNANNNIELAHHRAYSNFAQPPVPPDPGYPARIANHSWNFGHSTYDGMANIFEGIVLDATVPQGPIGPIEPMTVVFSAGNSGPSADTIRNPANAKNVITVGSVDSYDLESPTECPTHPATTDDPLDGPFVMSEFSARGEAFGPGLTPQVHNTRVKPDVVAPGWLIEGPRRETSCLSGPCGANGFNAVTIPGPPVYAYGRGTSFAAPAVSGVLALSGKQLRAGRPEIYPPWMQNGLVPTPSLLKAGLIATARSLGPVDASTQAVTCTGGDCRPSHHSGWGLVDLDRLTDPAVPVFVRNEQTQFVDAGDSWTSPPLVRGVAGQEVLIALVWSDVPALDPTESLQRDLDLKVTSGSQFWVGNNFTENHAGSDTGYSLGFSFWDYSIADRVNNVETVFLQPTTFSENDEFRIVVHNFAHGPSSGDYVTQSFSVYAWNAKCRYANPLPPNGDGQCRQ